MLSPVPALAVLTTLTCAPDPPWLDEMVQVVELEGLVSTEGQLNAATAGCDMTSPTAVTESISRQSGGRGSERRGCSAPTTVPLARKGRFAVGFPIVFPSARTVTTGRISFLIYSAPDVFYQ
ncbi:hypothetical protein ACMU6081_15970 [Achromobacter mucicolens]